METSSNKILFKTSFPLDNTFTFASTIKPKHFLCKICEKPFSTNGNLKNHIQTIHHNKRPFKCSFPNCDKAYPNQNRLETHKRTHEGIKPFQCALCHKTFNEKGNLKTHLLFHSTFRPFKCRLCNKAYKTKGHLKEHCQIQHDKIKKYKCTICSCYFGRNSNLNIHMKVHSKISSIQLSSADENESEYTQENSNEMHSCSMECDYDCDKIRNAFLLNEYDVNYDEQYSREKECCYGVDSNHKDLFSMILQQDNNDVTVYNEKFD